MPMPELTADAMRRFFDPDWAEHPCGSSGARILAAAAKVARAHGGRTEARLRTEGMCGDLRSPAPVERCVAWG